MLSLTLHFQWWQAALLIAAYTLYKEIIKFGFKKLVKLLSKRAIDSAPPTIDNESPQKEKET